MGREVVCVGTGRAEREGSHPPVSPREGDHFSESRPVPNLREMRVVHRPPCLFKLFKLENAARPQGTKGKGRWVR